MNTVAKEISARLTDEHRSKEVTVEGRAEAGYKFFQQPACIKPGCWNKCDNPDNAEPYRLARNLRFAMAVRPSHALSLMPAGMGLVVLVA